MHTRQGPEARLQLPLQSPWTHFARKVSGAWLPLWERGTLPSPLKSACGEGPAGRLHVFEREEMNELAFNFCRPLKSLDHQCPGKEIDFHKNQWARR